MPATDIKQLFVSVGSRFAMPRLLQCVDTVLEKHAHLRATAQTGAHPFESTHMQTQQWIDASEFEHAVKVCDVFISHAGMGNILLAAKYKKPLIIMPRQAYLGEHVNDHQRSTAIAFKDRPFILVANNTVELELAIINIASTEFHNNPSTNMPSHVNHNNRQRLISALKNFIDHETV